MPTKKDFEWVGSQGGRTVTNGKGENLEKEKPSLADKILAHKERMKEAELVTQASDEGEGGKGESLATTIVTKSIDATDKAVARLNEDTATLKKEIAEGRLEAQNNWKLFIDEKLERIKDAEAQAAKSAQKAGEAGAPPDVFAVYDKVQGELAKLLASQPPPAAEAQTGIKDETRITLARMELDQTRVLAEIQAQQQQHQQEFAIRMAEFTEESKRRWAEYNDGKRFKEQGLSGFQDLAAAIGAGIRQDQGEAAGIAEESSLEASLGSFPCQFCHTNIEVPPGTQKVVCPNEECGATFNLKGK